MVEEPASLFSAALRPPLAPSSLMYALYSSVPFLGIAAVVAGASLAS